MDTISAARSHGSISCLKADQLTEPQIDELCALYQREWWTHARTRADVVRMLANTDAIVALVDDAIGRLVAFARILSDRVYKALIFDVIVHTDYRRRGVGRLLLETVLRHPAVAGVRDVELYCRPELESFYERWGFTSKLDRVSFMRRSITPSSSPSRSETRAARDGSLLVSTARSRSIE